MMERTFGCLAHAGRTYVYDPCEGSTRVLPYLGVSDRRQTFSDAQVLSQVRVHPASLAYGYPVSICWSPLVACNLRCPHCLDDKSLRARSSLERKRLASCIASSGVVGIDISGGEPLLLKDLPELLSVLRAEGKVVSVTTNGWHLAERLDVVLGLADAVRVSLDGATAAGHDALRGEGSFRRAINSIQQTVAAGMPTQVHFVAMRRNLDELHSVCALASHLGANGITILQFLPIGRGDRLGHEECVSDAELSQLIASTPSYGLPIRARLRSDADGFTVVRSDGYVWRNAEGASTIARGQRLLDGRDLRLTQRDGSS